SLSVKRSKPSGRARNSANSNSPNSGKSCAPALPTATLVVWRNGTAKPSNARAVPFSPPASRVPDVAQARRAYQAELDAIEIWVQVARHDASAADRLIDRF